MLKSGQFISAAHIPPRMLMWHIPFECKALSAKRSDLSPVPADVKVDWQLIWWPPNSCRRFGRFLVMCEHSEILTKSGKNGIWLPPALLSNGAAEFSFSYRHAGVYRNKYTTPGPSFYNERNIFLATSRILSACMVSIPGRFLTVLSANCSTINLVLFSSGHGLLCNCVKCLCVD